MSKHGEVVWSKSSSCRFDLLTWFLTAVTAPENKQNNSDLIIILLYYTAQSLKYYTCILKQQYALKNNKWFPQPIPFSFVYKFKKKKQFN